MILKVPNRNIRVIIVCSVCGTIQELAAGGLAGLVGKTSVAPLERVKILFQVDLQTSGVLEAVLWYSN